MSKQLKRIENLKRAGYDVSRFLSFNGGELILEKKDGKFNQVTDDFLEQLEQEILSTHTIPNNKLFRRFITAQVFARLKDDFTKSLHRSGNKYAWKMALEEYRVLSILEVRDVESFEERKIWFTKDVAISMIENEINNAIKQKEQGKIHRCKGVPYKKINKKDVFLSDFEDVIIKPFKNAIEDVLKATTYEKIYLAIKCMLNTSNICTDYACESKTFIMAYQGAGAYYSMKNLILFHNCKFDGMDTDQSIEHLKEKAVEYQETGYKLLGLMKDFVSKNNFDFDQRMRELGVRQ